jgi:hypothetical protein
MNEEPAWLRGDAAARTRKTEQDLDASGRAPGAARGPTVPDLAAEASRALAAGRPERLRTNAVLHLQRAAGNAGVAQLLGEERDTDSPVKEVVGHGGGAPLDAATRQQMEASFGASFSDVRVHTGGSAASSARAVNAHAYTVGSEIVLGDGQAPGSPSHERTLAHELTHVLQQRSGPVDGTPAPGGIRLSDPADRFETAAEATADAVLGTGRATDAGVGGVGASIQRQDVAEEEPEAPEEEEEVQALAVQRQEDEEEVQALAVQRVRREEEEEHLLLGPDDEPTRPRDESVYGPPMEEPVYGPPMQGDPAYDAAAPAVPQPEQEDASQTPQPSGPLPEEDEGPYLL